MEKNGLSCSIFHLNFITAATNWHKTFFILLGSSHCVYMCSATNLQFFIQQNHVSLFKNSCMFWSELTIIRPSILLPPPHVLLTMHLSITLANVQLDAQFLYFITRLLQSCTCFEQHHAHHEEVNLY